MRTLHFSPQTESAIEESENPKLVLAEIMEALWDKLPPIDAKCLRPPEGNEGALYLIVLPCGYRVTYIFPLEVCSSALDSMVVMVRPGADADLKKHEGITGLPTRLADLIADFMKQFEEKH